MDKKDIYEHLANIYLDASSKKKKIKVDPKLSKNILLISIVVIVGLGTALFSNLPKKPGLNSETALIIQNDVSKINFNFNPAKKEVYTINLNRLNVGRFNQLGFTAKNMHPKDNLSMRVEFTNSFKEKSEVYVKNIPGRWQDFKINLSEFKKIRDWSAITELSFTVEEWNAASKDGVLYIDNVRLLK
jgi:hypothetical protein